MKIIGLDVGEKRIGVARADLSTKIAVPVGYIEVDGTEWEKLKKLAFLNGTKFFVLGRPRSNEGNETKQTLFVMNFAKKLTEVIPDIKIRYQDESLTSVEAESRLKASKKPYEKGDIDAEAASIILQDFIETFSESAQTVNPKPTNLVEKQVKKTLLNAKIAAEKPKKIVKIATDTPQKIIKKARMKKILTPIIIVLILGLLAAGAVFWYFESLSPVFKNCDDNRCPNTEFIVSEGDSIDQIAERLDEMDLIRSSFFFKINLKLNHPDASLKTGVYTLNKGMSADEISTILAEGSTDPNVFSFTILPGETIFNIKKKLLEHGYRTEEIDEALHKDYNFEVLKDRPAGSSLEGYLFGETHEFYNTASVSDIFEVFLKNFDTVARDNNLAEKFAEKGLNLHQGITLASVVQKEAHSADQPTVAQVFLSRLAAGYPLGSDVTVSYALDVIDPERKTFNNNADALNVDSCYNTRKNTGLPCGPISNPGLNALQAVANPTDTNYFYFLTGDDGKMYYSYTEDEHNQKARDYCQVLCNVSL